MAREKQAESAPVSSEGDSVRRRRERLGLHKNELADAAGVSRDTLAAIESGEGFRRTSLTKIEQALEAAEVEAGIDAPSPEQEPESVQSRPVVINLDGGAVVVEGPIENLEALIAAAERLRRGASTG